MDAPLPLVVRFDSSSPEHRALLRRAAADPSITDAAYAPSATDENSLDSFVAGLECAWVMALPGHVDGWSAMWCCTRVDDDEGDGGVSPGRVLEVSYFVLPDSRGHGLIRASAPFVLSSLAGLGVSLLVALVWPENAPSIRILQDLGFSDAGEQWWDPPQGEPGRSGLCLRFTLRL